MQNPTTLTAGAPQRMSIVPSRQQPYGPTLWATSPVQALPSWSPVPSTVPTHPIPIAVMWPHMVPMGTITGWLNAFKAVSPPNHITAERTSLSLSNVFLGFNVCCCFILQAPQDSMIGDSTLLCLWHHSGNCAQLQTSSCKLQCDMFEMATPAKSQDQAHNLHNAVTLDHA